MGFPVMVDVARPPEQTFRYLADPRNRPEWQSSLRAVEDVVGSGAAGTTWTDVTAVGVRPRMSVTACEPFRVWVEVGVWRRIRATLALRFVSVAGGERTRVEATIDVDTPALLRPLALGIRLLGPPAVRSDLQRAARLIEG